MMVSCAGAKGISSAVATVAAGAGCGFLVDAATCAPAWHEHNITKAASHGPPLPITDFIYVSPLEMNDGRACAKHNQAASARGHDRRTAIRAARKVVREQAAVSLVLRTCVPDIPEAQARSGCAPFATGVKLPASGHAAFMRHSGRY